MAEQDLFINANIRNSRTTIIGTTLLIALISTLGIFSTLKIEKALAKVEKAILAIPKVHVHLTFNDVCGSYMETQKVGAARSSPNSSQSTKDCIRWAASYLPDEYQSQNKKVAYMTNAEVTAAMNAEFGIISN